MSALKWILSSALIFIFLISLYIFSTWYVNEKSKPTIAVLKDGERIGNFEPTVQLKLLTESDAAVDAANAFRRKEYRFMGIQSAFVICPGADKKLAKKYGEVVIMGSTDHIKDEETGELAKAAAAYAREYNEELNKLLRDLETSSSAK